jgi:hypothetical protein
MRVNAIGAYTPFIRQTEEVEGQITDKFQPYWRSYRVEADGSRSNFREIDALHLIHNQIQRTIDLKKLEHYGILSHDFPLHNFWKLTGSDELISS